MFYLAEFDDKKNSLSVDHGQFGQSNKHRKLNFCPDETSQKGIKYIKAKE